MKVCMAAAIPMPAPVVLRHKFYVIKMPFGFLPSTSIQVLHFKTLVLICRNILFLHSGIRHGIFFKFNIEHQSRLNKHL